MMKKTLLAAALGLLVAVPAAAQSFSGSLTGAAVVPGPGDSDGSGYAVVTLGGTSVTYSILTNKIAAPTGATIRRGAAGASGDVVLDLTPTFSAGLATGTKATTQAIVDEIKGNPAGFHVSVVNAEFAGGALRGQLGGAAVTEIYYPTVAKVDGLNDTLFVSDLSIVNPGTVAASITAEAYVTSPDGLTAPSAIASAIVPAGGQVTVPDVLGSLFGLAKGSGAARITADQPVAFFHKVINDKRTADQGTSLLNIGAVTRANALTEGWLLQLSQASAADQTAGKGYRTNIGWFNPTSTTASVTFTAVKPDGSVLGTVTRDVKGLSQQQTSVFGLISSVPEADRVQADFYVRFTSSTGLFVYTTVVDNKTGDGLYQNASPKP
ncbi:MAG: CHRD domain-containing protein [Thermoanaerobaculia bacterium]